MLTKLQPIKGKTSNINQKFDFAISQEAIDTQTEINKQQNTKKASTLSASRSERFFVEENY